MHFDEAIATLRERTVVRGHNEGDTFLGNQVEKKIKYSAAGLLVKRTRGFVREQDTRLVHQGAHRAVRWRSPPESFDSVPQPIIEPSTVGQLSETGKSRLTSNACRHGGDEAVLFEGQIGYEVMKLEDKADLMPKQA